jgi:hypothetical protein
MSAGSVLSGVTGSPAADYCEAPEGRLGSARFPDPEASPMQLQCYLMNGQYDQMGTSGLLELDDGGRLSFTLDKEKGTRGKLKWIEKALGTEGIQEQIEAGEKVVVFDTPVRGKKLKWPWNFRGRVFKVTDDENRSWLVSLVTPGGGGMFLLTSGTGLPKEWKGALAQAGAE